MLQAYTWSDSSLHIPASEEEGRYRVHRNRDVVTFLRFRKSDQADLDIQRSTRLSKKGIGKREVIKVGP